MKDTPCACTEAATSTLHTASPTQTNAILLFWVAIAPPLLMGVLSAKNYLGVLLISTERLRGGYGLTTPRSGSPSPLKPPTAMDRDSNPPIPKFRGPWKVPSPLPKNTETLVDEEVAG